MHIFLMCRKERYNVKTNSKIENIQTNEVLLNGNVVAKGTVSCSLISKIETDNFGNNKQIITIEGKLETGYYIPDLDTIETNRYYIEGVAVNKEDYNSSNNKITYSFMASLFQVKYQDERNQYYRIDKD